MKSKANIKYPTSFPCKNISDSMQPVLWSDGVVSRYAKYDGNTDNSDQEKLREGGVAPRIPACSTLAISIVSCLVPLIDAPDPMCRK